MNKLQKTVIVTTSWDDGHKLDIKLAKILKKYNIAGTFYISPRDNEFRDNQLLSNRSIKQLSRDFEIGAHTINHLDLTKIPLKQAEREIVESKLYLEKIINKQITAFCYPRGKYNNEVKKLVEKSGFKLSRTVRRFETSSGNDQFSIPTTINVYDHLQDLVNIPLMLSCRAIRWDTLAKKYFNYVMKHGGIFHLWGHSWEIDKYNNWGRLEKILRVIANNANVSYLTNSELALMFYE
jgi:peptidoglycan-N-acetylglucosamine deacetylase